MPMRSAKIGQAGQDEDQGGEPRDDQKRDGVDAHHGQGVDLLGDLHRAQFGGDGRAEAAGHDDRRQQRAPARA